MACDVLYFPDVLVFEHFCYGACSDLFEVFKFGVLLFEFPADVHIYAFEGLAAGDKQFVALFAGCFKEFGAYVVDVVLQGYDLEGFQFEGTAVVPPVAGDVYVCFFELDVTGFEFFRVAGCEGLEGDEREYEFVAFVLQGSFGVVVVYILKCFFV